MTHSAASDGRGGFGAHHEVTLQLDRAAEMFTPPALDAFGGSADLRSGVERLVAELKVLRPRGTLRATIVLPAAEVGVDTRRELRDAVARYCHIRIRDLQNERAAMRYDGLSALAIGASMLIVVLLLSQGVRHSGLPEFLRTFFVDSVLLVIAWVALWYPLDTLLYYGRPHTHELEALRALARAEIVLLPADAAVPPPVTDGGARTRLRRGLPRRHRPRPES
jgi:hypothetical protein